MKKITFLLASFLISLVGFSQQYEVTYFNNPSAFDDISSTGTALNLSDDGEANIVSSFPITMGSLTSTDLQIGNNGAVLFGTTSGEVYSNNTDNELSTRPMIAPFWDDFDDNQGNVYWKYDGSYLIIQWDRPHYDNGVDNAVFQIKIAPNGTIYFVYNDVDFGDATIDGGASATIGISTPEEVFQFSKNTASVSAGWVVKFNPSPTTSIPDANFEAYLETHNASGDVVALGASDSMGNGIIDDHTVYTSRIENVTSLDVNNQNIADLTGIADFVALTDLDCRDNVLTALDMSANTALTSLICYQNNIASLDVSNNTALTTLYCSNNALTTLNLNTNNQLEKLSLHSNPNLTTLHIQNGANNLLSGTYTVGSSTYSRVMAYNNPNLTCIFVDNATDANNGVNDYQDWAIDATAHYVATQAECDVYYTTSIPDANFEAYLETHNAAGNIVALGAADSMGNGVIDDHIVPTSRIENVTELYITNLNITDLTGIADFVALNDLDCTGNLLTVLNLNSNLALAYLDCELNNITSLNISNCSNLSYLGCYNNQLTTLDVSSNTSLSELRCDHNNLTTLDLTHNTNLMQLYIDNNNLQTVDLRNGNNSNITSFVAINNPDLHCIYVDDVAWSTTNWTNIDTTSNFVANDIECSATYPAPVNNDCSNATNLIVGADFDAQAITTTNIGATETVGVEASCGDSNQPEIWFTVTVPSSGNLIIETKQVAGSDFYDSVIAVYSGSCGSLTAIDCDDDHDGDSNYDDTFSIIELTGQTPGDVLYITAYSYVYEPFGEFLISAYDETSASISENTIEGLSMYPNPVNNTLHISANENMTHISIYNMLGQEVLEKSSVLNTVALDLSTLSTGNYILKIKSDNQIGTYKIIKQ